MDFEKIIGNDSLKSLIGSHIRNKTLSHAYIIEGPRYSGKKTLAKEICKALCCEAPGETLPCGVCRSCKRIEDGYNTDIYTLNSGDKASIQVQDVREMTSTLGFYPDDGDVKIYVIEEADKLTTQAQNALLLSLEEPPAYVVFLLLSENSQNLLETVRSRAQIFRTQTFSTDFTARWLTDNPAAKRASQEAVYSAATVSRGALGAALLALSDKTSTASAISKDAGKLVELLCKNQKSETIAFASGMKYSRREYEDFFDYALFAVRDLISVKCGGCDTAYYPDEDTAAEIARLSKLSKLSNIYSALVSAKDDITKNNAHIYAVMMTLAASAM